MSVIRSYCRNCTANCGTLFEVEEGRVVRHAPDRENAISAGFMCVKGDMAVDLLTGAERRLLQSQRRQTRGGFEPIATMRAIDEIAGKLSAIIARHGPRALGLYYGTSAYTKSFTIPTARSFLQAIGTPNLFSTMTIDSSAHWVCEGRMGLFRTGRPHIEDADLLLLSGTNPIVSHFAFNSSVPMNHQPRHLKALRQRGGKIIVIDPRRTETARMADIHIQPKPGFDGEIHAGLIRLLLERGWHDEDFTARYATNLDALTEAVAPFTPALVESRAGLAAGTLERIAEALRDAKRPSISVGTGVSMSPNGNTAVHMATALNVICGGFARAGDRIRHPGFFYKRATVEGVVPPNRTWESGPKLRSGHGQLHGEFGSSRMIDEMTEEGPGRIRALIVLGANPLMAFGEPERMRAALEGLDLLVVVDPRLTQTAALADYIVTTSTQYEVADFTFNNDVKFITPFVQYTDPVLPPPAEAVQEWRFFHELARRLGHTLTLASTTAAPSLTLAHDREWTDEDLIRWRFETAGLSFDEVRGHPGGMTPTVPAQVITAPESDDGARLDLCPPDVAAEMAALAARAPVEGYAYRLTVRRIVETMNSAFRFSAATQRRYPTNPLYVHPDDLVREGIADGGLVEVSGEHGSMRAYVKADATMRPGTVSMTHCWGAADPASDPLALQGSHTSRLVSMRLGDVQDIDAMPMHSALPVNLVPVVPDPAEREEDRCETA